MQNITWSECMLKMVVSHFAKCHRFALFICRFAATGPLFSNCDRMDGSRGRRGLQRSRIVKLAETHRSSSGSTIRFGAPIIGSAWGITSHNDSSSSCSNKLCYCFRCHKQTHTIHLQSWGAFFFISGAITIQLNVARKMLRCVNYLPNSLFLKQSSYSASSRLPRRASVN